MNKRDETIELLAKGLNYNLRYDTLGEIEIEEMAQILHETLSFDIGPVNDAEAWIKWRDSKCRKDARKILSLINETHVHLDKKVKVRCRNVATHICDYCIREKQSCEGRANGGYITKTVGGLVEGENQIAKSEYVEREGR